MLPSNSTQSPVVSHRVTFGMETMAGRLISRETIAECDSKLPVAFELSLMMLEKETALQEILGADFVRAYGAIKRAEFETFFQVISAWEREFLLLNV